MATHSHYNAVIVGGGHNGLVAAAYLARAGLSVLLLERLPHVGGAAVSARVFKGVDARLSRFAYLVSLLPPFILRELGIAFEAKRRRVGSFTPTERGGAHRGLLVSSEDDTLTEASFVALTGSDAEYRAYQRFYTMANEFARLVFPTLTQPLVMREQMRARFAESPDIWEAFVERPLGEIIETLFHDDLIRGAVFTDAKIGTLTHPHDESLLQNRCFLYHVMGGEWRVPAGGMGALTGKLAARARELGVDIWTETHVTRVTTDGTRAEVTCVHHEEDYHFSADWVLSNLAPVMLYRLMGTDMTRYAREGCAFKINMLLKRLPRLRSGHHPQDAFAGTLHFNEGYEAMTASYQQAKSGRMPDVPPGEVYCHTLTDTSILSPELAAQGYQTLTLFGLDMPAALFREDRELERDRALRRYLRGINTYLEEPIQDCLALDADGEPCIEAKCALDIESELGMPGGHIFHNDLSFPFVDDDALAGKWGVETGFGNVLICGSGALRGGGVSGIPGHNAAMAVLARRGHGK